MTFILSEDAALRNLLLGVKVSDQKAVSQNQLRPVRVYFGQPDQEITDQLYPYITIDMIDIQRDIAREMRGIVKPSYMPDPETIVDANGDNITYMGTDHSWKIHLPIPVAIDYQITTYCRQPLHDRSVLAQILGEKLPFRFGQVSLDDGTNRRIELMDVSKRDNNSEQAKRLFVNVFTIRISSEIVETQVQALYKAKTIDITTLEILSV